MSPDEDSAYPANRLIHEKSPYLLQHAHNPVDWYPWSPPAFEKAAREDKPIFLSIGYSTCHWCHVMAHESFQNPEVAALLNQRYISIKVDREERPDIDQVYMAVCQAMTGQGGWPLTIVMTPDRKPFFAATYLPPHHQGRMPGLLDILPRLADTWKTQKEDIEQLAGEVIRFLKEEGSGTSPRGEPSLDLLDRAYRALSRAFDPRYGGFGPAPKFPAPHQLLFLLRVWDRTRDPHALAMVEDTLKAMRRGGLFDHIGLGFHRYSVDERWVVPHFEKMLYDQALLAIAYLEAFQATRDRQYGQTAREIFTYVLRDLRAEKGGFYSGEDADSEGIEGKYYLWTWEELETVLDSRDLELFSRAYTLRKDGNLPFPLHGAPPHANILHRERSWEDLAREEGVSPEEFRHRLERIRIRLLDFRSRRIRPARDTKILADGNGLMIAALAMGGRILQEPEYTREARHAEGAIMDRMRRAGGRLNHAYSSDESYVDGFSADYAAMVWAEIELYETTFEPRFLEKAMELLEQLAEWYRDREKGGYFFTPSDGESLLIRKKEAYDGAVPSANSLAVYGLLRIASLTGKSEYADRGRKDWNAFSGMIDAAPQGFTFLLLSADYYLGPTLQVVITGGTGSPQSEVMIRALTSGFFPRLTVHVVSGPGSDALLTRLAPFLAAYPAREDACAFVCRGHHCLAPTADIDQMIAYLSPPNGI
jgi:uncharacterized protein YyaL (SSP411 family)